MIGLLRTTGAATGRGSLTIDFNVEYSRGRGLGDHSSWKHVEVLEPLENACKRTGVRVSQPPVDAKERNLRKT
jgi:hypothetical protein